MAKVTQSTTFDFDDFELLVEIKSKYHLKNISQAVHTLIRHYQLLLDDKARAQTAAKETSKNPSNPMVNL